MALFDDIVKYISMSDDEIHELRSDFSEVKLILETNLPGICNCRPFGSFGRRTRLSDRIAPGGDIDLLLVQTADQHRELYRSNVERWADDIRKILQSTGLKDGYEVIGDSAFLTLKTKKRSFDIVLSVVTGEADDSMHLVYLESGLPDTQTRRGRSRYIGNAVSYEKSTGLFLQPDYYPVDQYEAMYKSCWRDLIVIWKYWKLMSRSTINSWIIEYNVLEKLNNTRWLPVGSYTRLKFVATYFANKKNFHNSLFMKEPYFIEFVESVIAASDATDREDHVTAARILAAIFPVSREIREALDELDKDEETQTS